MNVFDKEEIDQISVDLDITQQPESPKSDKPLSPKLFDSLKDIDPKQEDRLRFKLTPIATPTAQPKRIVVPTQIAHDEQRIDLNQKEWFEKLKPFQKRKILVNIKNKSIAFSSPEDKLHEELVAKYKREWEKELEKRIEAVEKECDAANNERNRVKDLFNLNNRNISTAPSHNPYSRVSLKDDRIQF